MVSRTRTAGAPSGRPRLVILFADSWLAFSPSTINLYDSVSGAFDTTLIALEPEILSKQKLIDRNVCYVRVPPVVRLLRRVLVALAMRPRAKATVRLWIQAILLYRAARKFTTAEAIGVDLVAFWAAQKAFGMAHLLSLEVDRAHPFFALLDPRKVLSVITQSEERYRYLFPEGQVRRFIVQNAPVFRGRPAASPAGKSLIYAGTALRAFGVFACIDFIDQVPGYSLTIHGAIPGDVESQIRTQYEHLLYSGRLLLDSTYVATDDLPRYLSKFAAGFCFYDMSVASINTFNYHTAPSGKLFSYLAAGVPVVGSDLPGLSLIRERSAGVLIGELTVPAMLAAIESVLQNRDDLRENCLALAEEFSFDRAIVPFRKHLIERLDARGRQAGGGWARE